MRSKGSQFLTLEVPGLAEKRPSLVYGDYIFAKLACQAPNDKTPQFQVCSYLCTNLSVRQVLDHLTLYYLLIKNRDQFEYKTCL